jgi:hypothetical protein
VVPSATSIEAAVDGKPANEPRPTQEEDGRERDNDSDASSGHQHLGVSYRIEMFGLSSRTNDATCCTSSSVPSVTQPAVQSNQRSCHRPLKLALGPLFFACMLNPPPVQADVDRAPERWDVLSSDASHNHMPDHHVW